jgi:hypothetical protein
MQNGSQNGKYKCGNGSLITLCLVLMTSHNKVSHLIFGRRFLDSEPVILEVTFAEVKRQLSQEEHERVEKGGGILGVDDDAGPSAFIIEGLELEETQCVIVLPISFDINLFEQQADASCGSQDLGKNCTPTNVISTAADKFTEEDYEIQYRS